MKPRMPFSRVRNLAGLTLLWGCAMAGVCAPKAAFKALAANDSDENFERLLDQLPTVDIRDGPAVRTLYVWDGDLLLNAEQIRGLWKAPSKPNSATIKPELKVNMVGNQRNIWKRPDRRLTYAFDTSFTSPANRELVARNLAQAAQEWEAQCPACGVSIRHLQEQDGQPDLDKVTFVVHMEKNSVPYIAAAFFPYEERYKHRLSIGAQYFSTSYDKVGILRHELGHILGYRHEHIGIPGCASEDGHFVAVTPYAPKSVMHYLCGNGGNKKFSFAEEDKVGHRETYMTEAP